MLIAELDPEVQSRALCAIGSRSDEAGQGDSGEFLEIPVLVRDDMVHDLVEGLERIFQDYTVFIASCGSKQSYILTIVLLTRCNQDLRLAKLWTNHCQLIILFIFFHNIINGWRIISFFMYFSLFVILLVVYG